VVALDALGCAHQWCLDGANQIEVCHLVTPSQSSSSVGEGDCGRQRSAPRRRNLGTPRAHLWPAAFCHVLSVNLVLEIDKECCTFRCS
jgi:hypothetical protein